MRRLVLAAAVLLSVGTAATPAVAATHNKADAASGWLARQMVDGERFEADFGGQKFPDQGLTIDAIFAFAASRSSDTNAEKAITWLAKPEITSGYIGSGTEAYA
ncbi:MAG TPA: peptidase, partial [Lentzea sp.]